MRLILILLLLSFSSLYSQTSENTNSYQLDFGFGLSEKIYYNEYDKFIDKRKDIWQIQISRSFGKLNKNHIGFSVYYRNLTNIDSIKVLSIINDNANYRSKLANYVAGSMYFSTFGVLYSYDYTINNNYMLSTDISTGAILTIRDDLIIEFPNSKIIESIGGYDWGYGVWGGIHAGYLLDNNIFVSLKYHLTYGMVLLDLENRHGNIDSLIVTSSQTKYTIFEHGLIANITIPFDKFIW